MTYEINDFNFSAGNDVDSLEQKRDIYKGSSVIDYYYFLNYDKENHLTEVEVHKCKGIQVFDLTFDYDDELDEIALTLSRYSNINILSRGEIFFTDLNMVICDIEKMGSEGNILGYFYCSSNVSHLL